MRAVRLTWMIGGGGLVVCAVIGMLQYAAPGTTVLALALDVLFAAAVLLFTFGLSRPASVVDRRPLGVSALLVVALWPVAVRVAQPFLPTMDADTFDAGLEAYRAAESVLTAVFLVDIVVSLAAGLVAAVQIARAGTVPAPWRWAPMWALGICVASGVIPQLMFASAGATGDSGLAEAAIALGALGFLARTLGLGIIALVLAARVREESVEIYRSA